MTVCGCRSYKGLFPDIDPLKGEGEVVVTAGDDGRLRLFSYPCVIEDAPDRCARGPGAHTHGVVCRVYGVASHTAGPPSAQ